MVGHLSSGSISIRLILALFLSCALHLWVSGRVWQPQLTQASSARRVVVAVSSFRVQSATEVSVDQAVPVVEPVAKPPLPMPKREEVVWKNEEVKLKPIETPTERVEAEQEPMPTPTPHRVAKTESLPESFVEDPPSKKQSHHQLPTMTEPRYRKIAAPKYPKRARRSGQQGVVMVRARVDVGGKVESVQLLASSGHNILDMRALATVRQWEFYPHKVAGAVTDSWVDVPVQFSLNGR